MNHIGKSSDETEKDTYVIYNQIIFIKNEQLIYWKQSG